MKILVFAAHPDDAEVCVGGSICQYVQQGHQVHVVNMTNAKTVRVACAKRACDILGCSFEFMDFKDIDHPKENISNKPSHLGIRVDSTHLKAVEQLLRKHRPDRVWAHWPVDTHADHIAAGSLVMRACDIIFQEQNAWQPQLWFFAPGFGYQAICFHPNHYEDISQYIERKKEAVLEYEVVNILNSYPLEETAMKFHGYASGYAYAEAFVQYPFRVRGRGDAITEKSDVEVLSIYSL